MVLNKYNSSLNNVFTGPPPAVPMGNSSKNTTFQMCYDAIGVVCKDHLTDHLDCGSCKTLVPGAWDILSKACGNRPINNFHECCHSYFPSVVTMAGSLVEVLVSEDGGDAAPAFCVEPHGAGNMSTCPTWAGGSATVPYNATAGVWFEVDILSGDDSSVTVDLTRLNGTAPVAVRYSWDTLNVSFASQSTSQLLVVDRAC